MAVRAVAASFFGRFQHYEGSHALSPDAIDPAWARFSTFRKCSSRRAIGKLGARNTMKLQGLLLEFDGALMVDADQIHQASRLNPKSSAARLSASPSLRLAPIAF